MPRPSKDEKPVSGRVEIPEVPLRPASVSRKGLLLLVMYVLGIPVFLVMLIPPITGGWILLHQYILYRTDERWHEFSLFEFATQTLDEELAGNLGWPELAACNRFREAVAPGPTAGGEVPEGCPQLSPWQSWLLHPAAYPEWHRRVERVLRAVPVSSVLFFFGLLLAFLLRLFGTDWKPRLPHFSSARSPGNEVS